MKKQGTFLAAALIFAAGTLFAQKSGGRPVLKQMVTVGEVTEEIDLESRKFPGLVLSPSVVQIVPRVQGEILKVGFKDGAAVKKGQMLYQLDSIKYQAAVKSAEANVAEYKAKVKYAKQSYDRTANLYTKEAASLDTKENTESILEAFNASLLAAEASLISAKEDLKNCTIVSPIDGIAGATNFTAGNYITPNSGTLVTVLQSDPIRVKFPMSIRIYLNMFKDLASLRANGIVKVIRADDSVYKYDGYVELIDNQANRNTDSIIVYVLFPNPDRALIPASTVTVTLTKKSSDRRPSVTPGAILHDSKGSYVYKVNGNDTVSKQYVVLGGTNGQYQIILSGLSKGERIVVDGTHKLFDGAHIEYAPLKK